ncbi:MAG: aminoacyl-tRNA hydrolase [bacterium]|nr:aminoacyl-tRNA hydrolase [bacterium]
MDFQSKSIKLIIGLGNPGQEYENTYHNAGNKFVDFLKKKSADSDISYKKEKTFEYAKANGLILAKTLVFMNESGLAVKKAAIFTKTKPEEILIVHDDSDLNIGDQKISFNRGTGGHKGVESIANNLKTKNFWRLRIGIRPEEKIRSKAGSFVLKNISTVNLKKMENLFEKIIKEKFA